MAKRRVGAVALLVCLCLWLLPSVVLADTFADSKESIVTDKLCTLNLQYSYDGTSFSNKTVKLYRIADVSERGRYTPVAPFDETGIVLNGIQSTAEWNVIRQSLEAYILADKVAPIQTAMTDAAGQAQFLNLTPGLYLASGMEVAQEHMTYCFASSLLLLPSLGNHGYWQYRTTAAAKGEALPPVQPDEKLEWKVVKLWKGDEGRTDRPKSVEVEIFRNGESVERVTLSEETGWSYSWSAKDDGATWHVVERNVPAGYTMTLQQRDYSFLITNTRPGEPKPEPPKTGDSANMLLYTVLLCLSGTALVILGIVGNKKRHEETNED